LINTSNKTGNKS